MVSTDGQHASPQVAWTGPVNGTSYDVITAANQAGGLAYWWVYGRFRAHWNAETGSTASGMR